MGGGGWGGGGGLGCALGCVLRVLGFSGFRVEVGFQGCRGLGFCSSVVGF